MKRREVLKKVSTTAKSRELVWEFERNGANHDVYTLDGLIIPIPRHSEIGDRFAQEVFKECEPRLGSRWRR